MIKPITPAEALKKKKLDVPEAVLEVWNATIAKNLKGKTSLVMQEEIVELLASKMECTRSKVFDNDWLEIEQLYRDVGWKVVYDKPGYNEGYEAYFTFNC
jgi:hypothetical protein